MTLFDSFIRRKEVPTRPPEGIDQATYEGTRYFRRAYKELIQQHEVEFDHLQVVGEVIDCLQPNLAIDKSKDNLLLATAGHVLNMAEDDPDIRDAITIGTIEQVGNNIEAEVYWLNRLMAMLDSPASLSRRAGVYRKSIRIDVPTETHGAAEVQKTLAAMFLHKVHMLSVLGNTRLHPKFDKSAHINRSNVVINNKSYLLQAGSSELDWQKQQHLQNAKAPLPPRASVYSHTPNIYNNKGFIDNREINSPEEEMVRLFRFSHQNQMIYYLDIPVVSSLLSNTDNVDKILHSRAKDTTTLGLAGVWDECTDGDMLWKTDQAPPSFSISLGGHESGNTLMTKAMENGSSHHIDFSHNKVIVSLGHLIENGGAAKLGVSAASILLQERRSPAESLQPDNAPKTEIAPPYTTPDLPVPLELAGLELMLRLSRVLKIPAHVYHENLALNNMLDFFGLQDVRSNFDEIEIPGDAPIIQRMNAINAEYHSKQLAVAEQFVQSHSYPDAPIGNEGKEVFYKLAAHKFSLHEMIGISFAKTLGLGAFNKLSLIAKQELSHTAIPSGMDLNNHEKIKFFQAEQALGLLGHPLYNLYQARTSPRDWRKWQFIGAEDLGQVLSGHIADFFKHVPIHMSSLDSPKRKVTNPETNETKIVEIDNFTTAFPVEEKRVFYAYADFNYQKGDKYYLRPTFRTYLRPNLVEALRIDKSADFNLVLGNVMRDLTIHNSEDEVKAIESTVSSLLDDWEYHRQHIGKDSGEENIAANSIILTALVRENQLKLRRSNKSGPLYQGFQILLATAIRLDQLRLLKTAVMT